ncbi:hypothetical protein LCGC14_0957300 [marine sediment metagenome]|uniref:Uncharacterized protein n=1 Tax=marine sediment metagenome TaxID=412755 RepID=A0A0F9P1S1_9ZZZZ
MNELKNIIEKIKEFGYSKVNIIYSYNNPNGSKDIIAEVYNDSDKNKTCGFKFDAKGNPSNSLCLD